jgi:hypothetical protein
MVGELYTYQMLGYKRIALYLTIKQKGLSTMQPANWEASPIVKKHGKPPRYYHLKMRKKDKVVLIALIP